MKMVEYCCFHVEKNIYINCITRINCDNFFVYEGITKTKTVCTLLHNGLCALYSVNIVFGVIHP